MKTKMAAQSATNALDFLRKGARPRTSKSHKKNPQTSSEKWLNSGMAHQTSHAKQKENPLNYKKNWTLPRSLLGYEKID